MKLGLGSRKGFVTGASRGIGRAIASAFAAEGIHLALFGRDQKRCKAIADDEAAENISCAKSRSAK